MLLVYTTRVWFVHKLLLLIVAKVIKKYDIDTKDPSTINYTIIYTYVEKSIVLEKAIQRIYIGKAPNVDQKVELEELVDWFQARTNITKEKKLVDLVVTT